LSALVLGTWKMASTSPADLTLSLDGGRARWIRDGNSYVNGTPPASSATVDDHKQEDKGPPPSSDRPAPIDP
jgi:hypothetical protein